MWKTILTKFLIKSLYFLANNLNNLPKTIKYYKDSIKFYNIDIIVLKRDLFASFHSLHYRFIKLFR